MKKKYFENEILENLHLSQEDIDTYEFVDCKFINCSFERCRIYRCRFSECDFVKCHITEIKNEGSQISFLSFDNCRITGINWGLFASSGGFKEPVQKFASCALKYNIFSGMNFSRFNFSTSDITFGTFSECKLTESNFKGCDLSDTEIFKCDISKADFRNAKGYRVDVLSCKMKGARFSYPEVENLLHSLDIKIE